MKITTSQLQKALFIAVSRTYFKEIVNQTPGKGIVADGWDINIETRGIVISNKEFGDIIYYLEEGTKPHIIEAKNKKFLKFKKPETPSPKKPPIPGNVAFEKNGYIFSKKVRHPGIEARKFIYDIFNNSTIQKRFEKEFEKELEKII